jgi:putative ABC transport system permease protein
MLRSYFTVALRNVRRRWGYAVINLVGLAAGMGACLLIGLYVGDELSYDDFHRAADRIYVVGQENKFFGRSTITAYPLASMLEEELPAVERALRTRTAPSTVRRVGPGLEDRQRVLLADSTFFQFFSFPLIRGAPASVLDAPNSAVITRSMARSFFDTDDPVGQTLEIDLIDTTRTVTVRGVADDPPENSTIRFDLVVPTRLLPEGQRDPAGWGVQSFKTYARVSQPLAPDTLAAQTRRAVTARLEDSGRKPSDYLSLPLPELYLSDLYDTDGFRGQQRYLYIFGSVALFILLIAAVNYVNLVTAQAQRRAKEVGVRKVLGAGRLQLARQFLSESVLTSTAALLLALIGAAAVLPLFNAGFGTELSLLSGAHAPLLAGLAAIVLGVGVLAGAYPAFVLARFRPVRVLRGASSTTTSRGGWLRRGLVVLQFAISAALIVGTIVVYQQLGFMQTKSLGFDGAQVVAIDLPYEGLTADGEAVKQRLRQHPSVRHVSQASGMPAHLSVRVGQDVGSIAPEADTEKEMFSWSPLRVDYAFVETLGLELAAGRSFDRERGSDEAGRTFLINEAAAEALGWTPEEAVGKAFNRGSENGTVIGVVKNFHIASLREEIMPVTLSIGAPRRGSGYVAAKLAPDGIQAGMDHVRSTLGDLAPDATLDYEFLDDEFDAMYRSEERLGNIFAAFAGLAILIACMGLFGLAAYAAERRTKEIGIRKAMGASARQIVGLLSKEFAALVAAALVIGMPLAYWGMQQWLEDFAYRTTVGPETFALTAAAALAIAGLTVSVHALRAARTDPATTLRDE